MATDAELVQRTLQGDSSAFAVLMRKYQPAVLTHCRRLVQNPRDAEELTQDVFFQAYQKLDQLRDLQKFASWLKQIATNFCKTHLRRVRPFVMPLADAGALTARQASAEDELLHRELLDAVLEAIETLPERDHETIQAHLDGMTHREICEQMGLSHQASLNRLYRVRQKLREKVMHLLSGFGLIPKFVLLSLMVHVGIWMGYPQLHSSEQAWDEPSWSVVLLNDVESPMSDSGSAVQTITNPPVAAPNVSLPPVRLESPTLSRIGVPQRIELSSSVHALPHLQARNLADFSLELPHALVAPRTALRNRQGLAPMISAIPIGIEHETSVTSDEVRIPEFASTSGAELSEFNSLHSGTVRRDSAPMLRWRRQHPGTQAFLGRIPPHRLVLGGEFSDSQIELYQERLSSAFIFDRERQQRLLAEDVPRLRFTLSRNPLSSQRAGNSSARRHGLGRR